jgi:hypothetical protein
MLLQAIDHSKGPSLWIQGEPADNKTIIGSQRAIFSNPLTLILFLI